MHSDNSTDFTEHSAQCHSATVQPAPSSVHWRRARRRCSSREIIAIILKPRRGQLYWEIKLENKLLTFLCTSLPVTSDYLSTSDNTSHKGDHLTSATLGDQEPTMNHGCISCSSVELFVTNTIKISACKNIYLEATCKLKINLI